MLTAQDLRKKAQTVDDLVSAVDRLTLVLAGVDGNVKRLVYALPKSESNAGADDLLHVTFEAMQGRTWTVSELWGRTLTNDRHGAAIAAAITALGCTNSVKGLGKYLATVAKTGPYISDGGLELRRIENPGDCNYWTIKRV